MLGWCMEYLCICVVVSIHGFSSWLFSVSLQVLSTVQRYSCLAVGAKLCRFPICRILCKGVGYCWDWGWKGTLRDFQRQPVGLAGLNLYIGLAREISLDRAWHQVLVKRSSSDVFNYWHAVSVIHVKMLRPTWGMCRAIMLNPRLSHSDRPIMLRLLWLMKQGHLGDRGPDWFWFCCLDTTGNPDLIALTLCCFSLRWQITNINTGSNPSCPTEGFIATARCNVVTELGTVENAKI